MPPLKRNPRAGYTLIELLAAITLVVVVLILAFAGEPTLQPTADGDIAVGYEYKSPHKMKTVRVPKPLKGGQHTFELLVEGQKFTLEAGKPFWFTSSGFPDGVNTFIIRGINPSEHLAANDNMAFPTGISWMVNAYHDVTQNAIPYKPPWYRTPLFMWTSILTVVALGGGGLFWWWRKSQAD